MQHSRTLLIARSSSEMCIDEWRSQLLRKTSSLWLMRCKQALMRVTLEPWRLTVYIIQVSSGVYNNACIPLGEQLFLQISFLPGVGFFWDLHRAHTCTSRTHSWSVCEHVCRLDPGFITNLFLEFLNFVIPFLWCALNLCCWVKCSILHHWYCYWSESRRQHVPLFLSGDSLASSVLFLWPLWPLRLPRRCWSWYRSQRMGMPVKLQGDRADHSLGRRVVSLDESERKSNKRRQDT